VTDSGPATPPAENIWRNPPCAHPTGLRNTWSGNGGGIKNLCGHLKVEGSAIHGNRASNGGGVYAHQGRYRNPADSTDPASTRTEIVNTTITENKATSTGGGIHVNRPSGSDDFDPLLPITHGTITENAASSDGAGLHSEISDGSDLSISNTVIADNTSSKCSLAVNPGTNSGNASSDSRPKSGTPSSATTHAPGKAAVSPTTAGG